MTLADSDAVPTYKCVPGNMQLSRVMHDRLSEVFEARSRHAEVRGGAGTWFCPRCGKPMNADGGHVRCDDCGECLDEFIHGLVELHPHLQTSDLDAVVADATTVRVTAVGALNPRKRSATKIWLLTSEPIALAQLREALAIDRSSLDDQFALMTPGVLDLHFFRGHHLLATVSYIPKEFVRWAGWIFDARLREPERLATWLSDRGVPAAGTDVGGPSKSS